MHKSFKLPQFGLEVEIGKFARQANGSAWLKCGNNVVLSTVVACKEPREFIGFFPLSVEYRERTSAAGKFPGGFIKREGRLSDIEILTSRLIDRPIRPLFPSFYFNEVQILSTVYSADGKFPTNILGLIASSLALTISDIPFLGPIGGVQASKIDGKWKFNVTKEESSNADSSIIISGTKDGICMVEGYSNNISEEEMVDLIFKAHEQIKIQVAWQEEIQKELNVKKAKPTSNIDWESWKKKIHEALPNNFAQTFFTQNKKERNLAMESLQKDLLEKFKSELESNKITKSILFFLFDSILKEVLPDAVIKAGKRIDGRSFNQVRPLEIETGILPCVHGSAAFRRGETQALANITLGTAQDAQKIEFLIGEPTEKSFMLHYNFPPFSTGEVKPMRGVSRREIGHGYLAERSFLNVSPDKEKFPYTIRSVVDVLESNGSSSMATVCATTMALADGGVPIKDMISGIAMGMFKNSSDKPHILTDILGTEDAFGLMDFKITGTDKGIMAIQMDIKAKTGLTKELLSEALKEAQVARIHILDAMKKVLSEPRKSISTLAPRVLSLKVPVDKIGLIIGPSGKTIKEIISETETQIDIADDGSGTVMIYAKEAHRAKQAAKWIKILSGEINVGDTFEGAIKKIADFGLFVELVPGKDGLIHISKIDKSIQRDIHNLYKVNDILKVTVRDYDEESGRVSLISEELLKPKK